MSRNTATPRLNYRRVRQNDRGDEASEHLDLQVSAGLAERDDPLDGGHVGGVAAREPMADRALVDAKSFCDRSLGTPAYDVPQDIGETAHRSSLRFTQGSETLSGAQEKSLSGAQAKMSRIVTNT